MGGDLKSEPHGQDPRCEEMGYCCAHSESDPPNDNVKTQVEGEVGRQQQKPKLQHLESFLAEVRNQGQPHKQDPGDEIMGDSFRHSESGVSSVRAMGSSWHVSQSFDVTEDGRNLLKQFEQTSVKEAVEALSHDDSLEGIGIVYSKRIGRYFVVYREDQKRKVYQKVFSKDSETRVIVFHLEKMDSIGLWIF